MTQTIQGYFQKGQFISPDSSKIPDNIEVFVTITGRDAAQPQTKSQQQLSAFNKFVSAVRAIDDEPLTDEDFAELENNRVSFDRAVAL